MKRSLLFALALLMLAPIVVAQTDAPPISWTCPMHGDVVEGSKGTCPVCKMNLVPVRLESVWTCPIHSVVAEHRAGKCPIDGRDLIQVTVALTWTCASHPEIDQIERGTCPDGAPMIAKRSPRPHGNHNPQHGGQFFMAPDNAHHLEGAYPRRGVFRLFLYDDFTRPLPAEQLKNVRARLEIKESAVPLTLTRNGPYLEANIGRSLLPAEVTAKVQFIEDAPEYRFDFTFATLSKEPVAPAPASASKRARVQPAEPPVAPPSVAAPTLAIGETVEEMLAQLRARNQQIRDVIQRGAFAEVYVPAFQAKDLALALDAHREQLSLEKRQLAEPAIRSLVRTAWLLDAVGDLGNRQQIDETYSLFASAVADVESALAAPKLNAR